MILPVVGLLLLLGLFWFWASSLIGDDSDTPATPSQQAIIVTPALPTATATVEAAITPVETTDSGETEGGEGEEPAPTEEEESESTGGIFEVGDLVAVTEDNVNLRSEPNTDSEIVEQMALGDQLRITGPPEESGDLTFWPVEDEVNDLTGYIAQDYLEPSE